MTESLLKRHWVKMLSIFLGLTALDLFLSHEPFSERILQSLMTVGACMAVWAVLTASLKAMKFKSVDTDKMSDEERSAWFKSMLTKKNIICTALYFYIGCLCIAMFGGSADSGWDILLMGTAFFLGLALLFFLRLLYIRIKFGEWFPAAGRR